MEWWNDGIKDWGNDKIIELLIDGMMEQCGYGMIYWYNDSITKWWNDGMMK